jgi:enoyl-CoA hydratase/carnithine racemase
MSNTNTTPSKLVLATVEGAVGTIILNRPQSLNAFNLDLAQQFLATLAAFDAD